MFLKFVSALIIFMSSISTLAEPSQQTPVQSQNRQRIRCFVETNESYSTTPTPLMNIIIDWDSPDVGHAEVLITKEWWAYPSDGGDMVERRREIGRFTTQVMFKHDRLTEALLSTNQKSGNQIFIQIKSEFANAEDPKFYAIYNGKKFNFNICNIDQDEESNFFY